MSMVPRRLLRNQKEIKKIHEEIKEDYLFAVKKSIVDFVLKVLHHLLRCEHQKNSLFLIQR